MIIISCENKKVRDERWRWEEKKKKKQEGFLDRKVERKCVSCLLYYHHTPEDTHELKVESE